MTKEEALLLQLRELVQNSIKNELAALERKLKAARQSRDQWKEVANRYQKQLIEERKRDARSKS